MLAPGLGQVFFIGDGQTDMGVLHQFIAPAGATPVFFGVTDLYDNCIAVSNSSQLDTDKNGDGITNVIDLGILRAAFFAPPGPRADGCN